MLVSAPFPVTAHHFPVKITAHPVLGTCLVSGTQELLFTAPSSKCQAFCYIHRSSTMSGSSHCSPFSHPKGYTRKVGTMYHKQCNEAPAGLSIHLVLPEAPHAGPRVVETSSNSPYLTSCQQNARNSGVAHIKATQVGVVLSANCHNTLFTQEMDS